MFRRAFYCTIPYFLGCMLSSVITSIVIGGSLITAACATVILSAICFLFHFIRIYILKKKYEESK